MIDMIERVARAMCESDGFQWMAASSNETANGETPDEQRDYWRDKAISAIEAMREPTDLMEGATSDIVVGTSGEYGESNIYCSDYVANKIWQAMIDAEIDAALKGEAE